MLLDDADACLLSADAFKQNAEACSADCAHVMQSAETNSYPAKSTEPQGNSRKAGEPRLFGS